MIVWSSHFPGKTEEAVDNTWCSQIHTSNAWPRWHLFPEHTPNITHSILDSSICHLMQHQYLQCSWRNSGTVVLISVPFLPGSTHEGQSTMVVWVHPFMFLILNLPIWNLGTRIEFISQGGCEEEELSMATVSVNKISYWCHYSEYHRKQQSYCSNKIQQLPPSTGSGCPDSLYSNAPAIYRLCALEWVLF
jgi:hypothetical protein